MVGALLIWWLSSEAETWQGEANAQAARLSRANEALEQYASSAAHDLKGPVRHVLLYGELLEEALAKGDTATARRHAKSIRDSALELPGMLDGMLDYSRDSSYERPDPKLIGQWKKKLTPDELALLEARIGPMLRERGYEESGVAPAEVGGARRFALALQDRLARFGFRRERYGLAHLVQARLARTLGSEAWQRRLLLAQNEIDNRHLQ